MCVEQRKKIGSLLEAILYGQTCIGHVCCWHISNSLYVVWMAPLFFRLFTLVRFCVFIWKQRILCFYNALYSLISIRLFKDTFFICVHHFMVCRAGGLSLCTIKTKVSQIKLSYKKRTKQFGARKNQLDSVDQFFIL